MSNDKLKQELDETLGHQADHQAEALRAAKAGREKVADAHLEAAQDYTDIAGEVVRDMENKK